MNFINHDFDRATYKTQFIADFLQEKFGAKKLALLFFLTAIILILLVAAFNRIPPGTIIKRMIIGGASFTALGFGVGQLIAYQLKNAGEMQNKFQESGIYQQQNEDSKQDSEKEQAPTQDSNQKQDESGLSSEVGEEMEALSLEEISKEEENIINRAQEAPEEAAEVIKNMQEE